MLVPDTQHVDDNLLLELRVTWTCPVLRAKHVNTCTIHVLVVEDVGQSVLYWKQSMLNTCTIRVLVVEDVEVSLSCTGSKACKHMHPFTYL